MTKEELLAKVLKTLSLWKDSTCDPWCNSQTSAAESACFRRCDCGSDPSNKAKRDLIDALEDA
jgi:hypothetical protein